MVESSCSYLVEQSCFATKNEQVTELLVNFRCRSVSENPVLTPFCLQSAAFRSLVGLHCRVEFTGGIWAWYLGGAKVVSFSSVGSCSYVARSAFDFVAVDLAQISEQVAKIHRCFVNRVCDLSPF